MHLRGGHVTGRTVAVNRDGDAPVRLLQVMITDINDIQTVQLVGQAGEEVNPPNGSLIAVKGLGEGMQLGIASDDAITPIMDVGGKRIYSTNAAGSQVMGSVRLDPDGTITATGPIGSLTLKPDGTGTLKNANGEITVQPDGEIHLKSPIKVYMETPLVEASGNIIALGTVNGLGIYSGGGGTFTIPGDVEVTGSVKTGTVESTGALVLQGTTVEIREG